MHLSNRASNRAGTTLTIDVGAVVANWRALQQRVGAHVACAGVVKADAYGLGADVIAPALQAAGCRHFFVASLDEGIALRPLLGEAARLYVLNGPLPGDAGDYAAHGLIPVLNSLEQIADWQAEAMRRDGAALPAVLHIDTGMSRLGLAETELSRLAAEPDLLRGVIPVLAMSHLACADETGHAMNPAQLAVFRRALARLPAAPASLSASSGIFLGPDYHFDLVRPGAALYGVNPDPAQPNPMAQVVRLQGKIIQVRDVDTPMTVGYGAVYRVSRKAKLAVVAAGYADGVLRSLGNRGSGLLGGVRVPIVGRVSMDLITFDVTAAPEGAARRGAAIDLIGPGHGVDELAAEAGTIGYEILTSLGNRYHRRHTGIPSNSDGAA